MYSSVRLLAEGVAQMPWDQYRDTADGNPVKMALGQLLSKPSAYINAFQWKYQYVSAAALNGMAVGLIVSRDGYGFPTTVEWLPSDLVTITDSQPYNPAQAKFYYVGKPLDRADLLLIPAFTIPGRTAGIAPIRYFQMVIEAGTDTLAYGADWFKGGGFPPGTFQNTQYEVEEEQADKIKAKLVRAQRRREPLVYGRDWEYKPVTVPPDQAQFVTAMQLNATQVASIFGVPPTRVGGTKGDSMTYANVESEQLAFVTDSLDPWLTRLECALADCLPAQQYMQFDRNSRLRMTPENRFAVYRAARDVGAMTANDVARAEGLPLISEAIGDDPIPLQVLTAMARGIKEIPKSFESLVTESPADQLAREQAATLAKEAQTVTPPPPVYPVTQAPAASNGQSQNGNGKQPATQGNGNGR